jgi:DNA polymerase (family X)
MKSYNEDFARLFNEIADLMEIISENPFKIRAYRIAARRIGESVSPITAKNADKRKFEEIPGIGEAIAGKMMQYVKTGKIGYLEDLRKTVPRLVREMLDIPHLGPKRVRDLYINLGVRSKKDLIKMAKNGEIDKLPGFGGKLVGQILGAIEKGQEKKRRHDRKDVEPIAKKLVGILKKGVGVRQVEIGGSYRRRLPTVGDLDILVSGNPDIGGIEKKIYKTFPDHTILASGETKIAFVIFPDNLQIDVRFVPEDSWGAALLYFTGSKDYNVMMRKAAIKKEMLLNEYGLFKDGEYIAGETEKEVYEALGLPYREPGNRK